MFLAVASAVAVCWPVVTNPGDTILCGYVHPDCLGNHWLLTWVADQLRVGGSVLHNDRYYWPVGDAPWLAGNGSEGFLYAPFHWALGWPLATTVYEPLILAANGLAAYTLCRAVGVSPSGSIAAVPTGTLFVFAVFELGAGRFSQVSICWLFFFLAAWVRFLTAPTVSRAVLAGALLAVTHFFYWYYGFFGVMAGALLLLWRRPSAGWLAVFSLAAVIPILPLLWVFLRYWAEIPGTSEDTFPHPESVSDSCWPAIPFALEKGRFAGRALPFTTTVLAALSLVFIRDRLNLILALVGIVFASLMAGALIPNGPYSWVYGLAGPLRRFWWPYRHVVVVNVVLLVLAARMSDRFVRSRPLLGIALALTVPLQLHLQDAPWHVLFSRVRLPVPFYESLAKEPGTLLLEPPLSPAVAGSQTPIMYQTIHRKALITGHALWVDRVRPKGWDAFIAANSFLAGLQEMERRGSGVFTFVGADLQSLLDAGLGPLVINREYFVLALDRLPKAYERVAEQLFGEPTVRGKRAHAYDTTRWNGETTATYEAWTWPDRVRPGAGTLSIQGIKPPSMAFDMPAPPKGRK